jgi:hypothetical protein
MLTYQTFSRVSYTSDNLETFHLLVNIETFDNEYKHYLTPFCVDV